MAKRAISSERIELDLNRYELRRGGKRIGIERIPMELLILLAQSGGRLLSREEIIEDIWGKNPWLDAERNLNTAIGKLRQALGDRADNPRFIETVVGKGYRFVAPVQRENDAGQSLPENAVRFELVGVPTGARPTHTLPENFQSNADREHSTAETVEELRGTPTPGAQISQVEAGRPARSGIWKGLLLTFAVLATALVAFFFWPQTEQQVIPHYEQITNADIQKVFAMGEYSLPILTDSLRLYFPVYSAQGTLAIGQVAKVGGESGVVNTDLPSPLALGVSPDGSELLVESPAGLPQAPVWIQPLPEGQPRRLGQIEARSATWSPDGSRIAFSSTSGLFIASSDGTNVQQLVPIRPDSGELIYWIRWRPDAQVLRYSLYDPKTGNHSLWQVNTNGSDAHVFLPDWNPAANECCGTWTPDGRFFVFAATQNGRSDIWAISERKNLLGRKQQPFPLTAGPISFSSPLPTRDGNVFVAGTETRGELSRWDAASKSMTPWLGGTSVVGVNTSADGKWITYTSFPDRTLWRSRIDGSDKVQLTLPPMKAYLPRWSPNGTRIAFYAKTPGTSAQVYTVAASGGAVQAVLPSERREIDPTWSPDGGSLMFESDPLQERGTGRKTQIEIVNLRNGKSSPVEGSVGIVSPRWSPNGRFIAAMPANSSGLVLFDFETKHWTKILDAQIGYPNWSHDGKYIYFDWFSSPAGVRRIRVADRTVEQVVTRQPGDSLWTGDDWTGLTADDRVLLLRNVSIQKIYALRWRTK
ncbi:MAG: PD40 domain-containing protein [Acidobacteriota bacterium]|nr:PD40 domain-containing protein [Acidobacteriota bacterium]